MQVQTKVATKTKTAIIVGMIGLGLIPVYGIIKFSPKQRPPADTTSPTIAITAPTNGTTVSGTVTISANASDNVGVTGVTFKVDGIQLGVKDTSSPYTTTWDTTAVTNDTNHALTAVATDAAGHSTTSASVQVTVHNTTTGGGRVNMITDPAKVFTVPDVAYPNYLTSFTDPTFNTKITRIGGNTGTTPSPVSGTWGPRARHVYSKQQAWNADSSLLIIENTEGSGTPSPLILDGSTYQPKYGTSKCAGFSPYDYRWMPTLAHANELVNVPSSNTYLEWYDVVNCQQTRKWNIQSIANDSTFVPTYGIGSGEGNVSSDGRYVALYQSSIPAGGTVNVTRVLIVDMDPQAPYAPYPAVRASTVQTIPDCNFGASDPCAIGNISVSATGKYLDVKYSGASPEVYDAHRIFDINPDTLALSPHQMGATETRCGTVAASTDGWIFPLKHADMMTDPYDNNTDVILGGRACPNSTLGRVLKIRLSDGHVTALTSPSETGYMHGSARALGRPGWFYVTYDRDSSYIGKPFYQEVVAVRLDGGAVERWAHYHSTAGTYRSQAHAVPSPDGMRVLFASDWAQNCPSGSCGLTTDKKDYVVDSRLP